MKPTRREFGLHAAGMLAASALPAAAEDTTASSRKRNPKAAGRKGWALVAPGIWRMRLGKPEELTPLTYRSEALRPDLIREMVPCETPPFDLAEVIFEATGRGCSIQLPMEKEERIYGLGLSTLLFDKTDRRVFLRPTDNPENENGESHAPVPFYVSTRGYGVYVDTARYVSFYTGNVAPVENAGATGGGGAGAAANSTEQLYQARTLNAKTMLIDVPSAHGVDLYVFGGPALADAVCRYNLLAGGGALPPLWGLGIAYRGKSDFSAEQSLQLARTIRAQHMPCDIWGIEPGWQTRTYSSSFVWDHGHFPDPDAFIRDMHSLGYRTSFWQHAFTHPTSPIHEPLRPFSGNFRVWDGLTPDFATRGARDVFEEHQDKVLFSKGADSVKLDECDHQPDSPTPWSFPEASVFPSGMDGEQYHSLFGKLYQQTMAEPLKKRNVRTWGLVRNSHALASPLPYVVYSDSYEHRCYVRGLANAGFSGLLWCPEVRDSGSVEELCRRVGTVIFSPYAMVNAWYLQNPPWVQIDRDKNNRGEVMANHKEAEDAVRSLFELRMSLVPYLYSAFNAYRRKGMPPTRALVMDWPGDAECRKIDDQFMVGPSLMVAPLFTGQAKRGVYLPPGGWRDFWTDAPLAGGRRIEVSQPLDRVPVFVKENTLLPLAEPVEHISATTCFALTVRVYGDPATPFTLYADDGETYDYETGRQNHVQLSWKNGAGVITAQGGYAGPDRYRVTAWKKLS